VSDAIIILQARTGSTRLPGKVLAPIGARTLLAHCLTRLRVGSAAPVIVATTTKQEDDCLVTAAATYCVPVFRGPEDDVLLRYVLAARSVGARYVVRATADNPLTDIDGPTRVLQALRSSGADHVIEAGLPSGAAVEGVTVDALSRAARQAVDPADREHVTPLIRRDPAFNAVIVDAPIAVRRPEKRLSVDREDDLRFMRQLAARMDRWAVVPELTEALRVIDASERESRVA
jgi:spore coat polysaccharide biosynthesis protein SpsF (cytidylyltransferase family)